jgi:hypothetical protein
LILKLSWYDHLNEREVETDKAAARDEVLVHAHE